MFVEIGKLDLIGNGLCCLQNIFHKFHFYRIEVKKCFVSSYIPEFHDMLQYMTIIKMSVFVYTQDEYCCMCTQAAK